MMACWPQICDSGSAISRAITSSELPAAVCTMIVTGRAGNSSARAMGAAATSASAKMTFGVRRPNTFIVTIPCDICAMLLYRTPAIPKSCGTQAWNTLDANDQLFSSVLGSIGAAVHAPHRFLLSLLSAKHIPADVGDRRRDDRRRQAHAGRSHHSRSGRPISHDGPVR